MTADACAADRPRGAPLQRQQLIIAASLVDKVPNLAGLARTCEVFRAQALALPDLEAVKDPLFASISVTAGAQRCCLL
jgi:tRNA guanosine-2'-O-methyltransferase